MFLSIYCEQCVCIVCMAKKKIGDNLKCSGEVSINVSDFF